MDDKKKRRSFMQALIAAGAAGMVATSQSAHALGIDGNIIQVGVARKFTTVQAALASITDATAQNLYLILVDAGTYVIADGGGPIELKPYVSISGVAMASVVFIGEDNNNFRCNHQVDLSDFTIEYSGSGNRSGAIRNDLRDLRDFHINHLRINVNTSRPAIAMQNYVHTMEIRNTTIVTQGIGIDIAVGGRVFIHDTNIHMFGTSNAPHLGIRGNGYCRIYVFGGKIGTGYGYGEVTDTSHDVIGVLADTAFNGRINLSGIWTICRNDGAVAGVNVNCVRVTGTGGFVRIFGSYLQAENPTGAGDFPAVANPGNGRIEIYGSRLRDYGEGPVYSSNQIGLQIYTAANHNVSLENTSGGLILLDASGGGFTFNLPFIPNTTAQYILKKIDTTTNPITIVAGTRKIDGLSKWILQAPYDKLHIRFANDQYYIVG